MLGRLSAITRGVGRLSEPLDPDFEEQAVERQNEEVLDALDVAARKELVQIERALERMERGVYAVCVMCGEAIPLARLRAVPYTDRCVDCAELEPA
ncbi:MAG: TraR/DksA family transcriptional regulator [Gammaproteobacteria bacterium]|nr:TraR/DksA family transcriptional regulator [Gammaproteobacteria bacterium]